MGLLHSRSVRQHRAAIFMGFTLYIPTIYRFYIQWNNKYDHVHNQNVMIFLIFESHIEDNIYKEVDHLS